MKLYASIRSTRLIITVTLLILVYIAYLFYIRLQSLIEYSNLVDETNMLKFKTEECFSLLKDAEIGQRGFLLTKDSMFLEPLILANENIYEAFDELKLLAVHDSDYSQLIHAFDATMHQRMEHLNNVVENDRAYKDYTGINVNVLLKGKLAMDEIRKTLNRLHQTINFKLEANQKIKNRYASITPLFMVVLSLLSITLVYIAYLIIMRELRARILVQNDLQYNIKALQRSNAELEQFAYVASHDLQEPLRKIQTFSNRLLVKHKAQLDEDGSFIVDRMQHAAERMRVLINDLLSYSQIVNSNVRKFDTTDLNVSLKTVLDVLSDRITAVNAKVSLEKLPLVKVNNTQIEQLLMNILTNALKFISPDRRPTIEIRYSSVEGQQIQNVKPADKHRFFHKISVKDNGIGFDEQYAEKIFVIFQRLQGKSEYTGTGIGLAMCKRIVENHDGYIVAKSKLDKGSEFMIFLPMSDQ